MKMSVDVVSDVVCPWCFIGKRNLDAALEAWRAEQPDCEVTVQWRPFFLNPDTPEAGEPYRPFLEKKFGGPEKLAEIWQQVGAAGRKVASRGDPGSARPSTNCCTAGAVSRRA